MRANDLLGQPTYLEGKPKGETSMLGKQRNRKVWNVACCKSWTHGEAEFAEAEFCMVMVTPVAVSLTRRHRKTPFDEVGVMLFAVNDKQ